MCVKEEGYTSGIVCWSLFSCVADEEDDDDIDFLLLFFLEDFHEYFKN